MEDVERKTLKSGAPRLAFLLCLGAELLSFLTYFCPQIRLPVLLAFLIGAVALALIDLRGLFLAAVVEAVIGSHGRLFSADIHGFSLSIRMVLFAVLLVGWMVRAARGRSRILHVRHAEISAPLLLLIAALALAAVRGLSQGATPAAVFGDANGYAFIALIPIGLDLFADRAAFAGLIRTLAGALAWLAAKSLLLLYLFSHDFGQFLADLYKWQRTFGLSEMTRLSGGAVRVFAASDLFLIPAVFLGVFLAWQHRRRATLWWSALAVTAFLLSLSRSFWLGSALAAACMLPVFVRLEIVPVKGLGGLFKTAALAIAAGGLLLAALAFFPIPARLQGTSALSVYGGRFLDVSDAAVSSRWNMIGPISRSIAAAPFLGQGFGAVITYQSDDPRMHDLYPGGRVTTGAIEWQYLEIWLKLGLFGLLAVIWLWWRIGLFFWRSLEAARGPDRLLVSGLMLSFLAFVVANVFTPYINHPLGWVFLALLIVGLHASGEHGPAGHDPGPRTS